MTGYVFIVDFNFYSPFSIGRSCADDINAASAPGHMLPDTSCIHLFVAVNVFLVSATNCRQFVARLLLDTKGYKSTVHDINA